MSDWRGFNVCIYGTICDTVSSNHVRISRHILLATVCLFAEVLSLCTMGCGVFACECDECLCAITCERTYVCAYAWPVHRVYPVILLAQ